MKLAGVPVEVKVEAIFLAICPDFPTPDTIMFPLVLKITLSTLFLFLL